MHKIPTYITIDITDRCNLHRSTCEKWKTREEEVIHRELNTQQWKQALNDLRVWLGKCSLIFSGGEPFLREDIFDLFGYARSIGIKTTSMTNGCGIERLCNTEPIYWPDKLIVSLNSVSDKTVHDRSRGTQGSCEQILTDLEKLVDINNSCGNKMGINISTVMLSENTDEWAPLAVYAKKMGMSLSFQLLGDTEAFRPYYPESVIDTAEYTLPDKTRDTYKKMLNKGGAERIRELIAMKNKGYPIDTSQGILRLYEKYIKDPDAVAQQIPCRVGYNNFAVDPYGNVRLCFNMPPIGNITDTAPDELWASEGAESCREDIEDCKMHCRLLACNIHSPIASILSSISLLRRYVSK